VTLRMAALAVALLSALAVVFINLSLTYEGWIGLSLIPFYLHLSVIMAVADYFTNDQLQRIGYAGLLAIEWAVTLPVSAAFVAILFWRAQETN